MKDGVGN